MSFILGDKCCYIRGCKLTPISISPEYSYIARTIEHLVNAYVDLDRSDNNNINNKYYHCCHYY